jgi:putative sterol carrier protein
VVPGVRHTRGTPPAVVEVDGATWVALATGQVTWSEAMAAGRIRASGERADLSRYLPLTTGDSTA